MNSRLVRLGAVCLLAVVSVLVGIGGDARRAEAAGGWFDGPIEYSDIIDCVSIIQGAPYSVKGAGVYVGFAADPNTSQPGIGQTYYVRVAVGGLGNSCSGQRADLNIKLPTNTSLDISGANPVKCFYDSTQLQGSDCPQSLPSSAGIYGAGFVRIPSSDTANLNLWPIPIGKILTVYIPVKSSTVLSGATLEARVKMFDGNSSPVLAPRQGVYVFAPTNANLPAVIHDTTSTTFTSTTWPTTIRSAGYVYRNGTTGNAYFDLYTVPTGGTSVFTDGPAPITSAFNAYEAFADWTPYPLQIQPNTTLYWELRYVPTVGAPVIGPRQSFTTPPANTSIVGTGTAASCTGAGFATSLASGQATVTFNCGTAPVEIQMTGEGLVSSLKTIDGGNLVTLRAAPNQRALRFTPAGTSWVKNLSITGGNSSGCGGGLLITAGLVYLDQVRVSGNHAARGGGVCVESPGQVSTIKSAINGNQATGQGGGAWVGYYLGLSTTDVSANTSGSDGGGIYSQGQVDVVSSTVAGNSAVGAGGGIRSEGSAYLYTRISTVSGNISATGGGISYSGSAIGYFLSSTIASNTATTAARGGGLEAITPVQLRNTMIAGNSPANCSLSQRQVTSLGFNLDSATSCGFASTGDVTNQDPLLKPLALWGGPTRTHALPPGSPAIDTAITVYCSPTDQRGMFVPGTTWADGDGNGSALCDIGSFEYIPERVAPKVTAIGRTATNPATGAAVTWSLVFSETVTGVDASDLTLAASGVTGSAITSVTPSGAANVYTVTASVGTGVGTLRLDLIDNDTVRDAANNALAGASSANGAFTGEAFDVNNPGVVPPVGGGGVPPAGASYRSLVPARLLETRSGDGLTTADGLFLGGGVVAAGSVLELTVAGRGGVPGDADAVVLNVTVAGAQGSGFVTVFPCGAQRPNASSVNYGLGQVVPNAVVAKVGAGGKVCLFTMAATDMIVDVNGYFPAGASYRSLVPARLLETRSGDGLTTADGLFLGGGVVAAGSVLELTVAGRGGVPGDADAVVLNVTVAGAQGSGFVTVFPCGAQRPNASSVNYGLGQVVPNAVVAKVGAGGKVCLFTMAATDMIVDVNGYFPAGL